MPSTSRLRPWLILIAALLAMLLTARLGLWQLDRAGQKQALQNQLDERARLPALTAAELSFEEAQSGAQSDRHVRLQGRWLSQGTVFLDNRPMAGRVGFFVLTPLILGDGRAVLVQRGWVPRDAQTRANLPELPIAEGVVEVFGRLSPKASQLYELGAADGGKIRQNVDLTAYAQETGLRLLPMVVVQLSNDPAHEGRDDGLLRQWAAPALGVQKHYGYAFQWFALCALIAGLYAWFQFLQPLFQRRAQHGK